MLELIPELRLDVSKPSLSNSFETQFALNVKKAQAEADEVNAARQPFIEKELAAMKPAFEAETASLTEAEREAEWKILVAKTSESLQVDIDGQLDLLNTAMNRLI